MNTSREEGEREESQNFHEECSLDSMGLTIEIIQSIGETRHTKPMQFSIGNMMADSRPVRTREVEIDMFDPL